MTAPVDPFIFVCATRYAIGRLTGASEIVADQVIAHADLIRQDHGARTAILREINDALDQPHMPSRTQLVWARARDTLQREEA
nr:MAG: hypothetical protein DIU80_20715 [Chloroflexota bacterium]